MNGWILSVLGYTVIVSSSADGCMYTTYGSCFPLPGIGYCMYVLVILTVCLPKSRILSALFCSVLYYSVTTVLHKRSGT